MTHATGQHVLSEHEGVPVQGIQAYGDVEAPFHGFVTLVLDRDERPGQFCTPTALPPGIDCSVPNEYMAGRVPQLVCMFWRYEIFFTCQESNNDSSKDQPISQSLHLMSYPNSLVASTTTLKTPFE